MTRTFSIHQPNFLPWIGYFDKIHKSDVFVIMDNVQIPRGKSVANRNKIRTKKGQELELVVPLQKPKGTEGKVSYQDAQFGDPKWLKKISTSLQHVYGKAEFFEWYFPQLIDVLTDKSFCEMNSQFIKLTCDMLEIPTEIVYLSELENIGGQKNELIISIGKGCNANRYLSGAGAAKYNDESILSEAGISLAYNSFTPIPYPQTGKEFIPYLSVVDLLFNCGPGSAEIFHNH